MKHLKIIIEPDNVQATMVSDYIADFFSREGWSIDKVLLSDNPSLLNLTGRTVKEIVPDHLTRCLSFTPKYEPKRNEKVVFWLLTKICNISEKTHDPFLLSKRFVQRQLYFRNMAHGTIYSLNSIIQDDIAPPLQSKILQLPPFIVSKAIPGPYNNSIVIEVDIEYKYIEEQLIEWLQHLDNSEHFSIYLRGVSKNQFERIDKSVKPDLVQIYLLENDDEFHENLRSCLCYVAIGIKDDLLQDRLELVAALLRPIVIVGNNAVNVDIFIDEITGFHQKKWQQFIVLMDLFMSRHIDATKMGEFAFRTLFSRRNPEKTLMECLE